MMESVFLKETHLHANAHLHTLVAAVKPWQQQRQQRHHTIHVPFLRVRMVVFAFH